MSADVMELLEVHTDIGDEGSEGCEEDRENPREIHEGRGKGGRGMALEGRQRWAESRRAAGLLNRTSERLA